jgi:hypothetical protein
MKNILVSVLLFGISLSSHSALKIIGGKRADTQVLASTVALITEYEGQYVTFCSGTVINSQVIVTASHCVDNYTKSELFVGWGEEALKSEMLKVSKVKFFNVSHPMEPGSSFLGDVAILMTEKPLTLSVSDIGDPSLLSNNSTLIQAGYGYTKPESEESEERMEDGGILYMLNSGKFSNSSSNLSTVYINNTMTSRISLGDSGGPLYMMEGNRLVIQGVLSGYNPSSPFFEAEYGHPYYYVDWMNCSLPQDQQIQVSYPVQDQAPCDGIPLVPVEEVPDLNRRLCRAYEGWDWDTEELCWPRTKQACSNYSTRQGFEMIWDNQSKKCLYPNQQFLKNLKLVEIDRAAIWN